MRDIKVLVNPDSNLIAGTAVGYSIPTTGESDCTCPDYQVWASLNDVDENETVTVLPFCDEFSVNVEILNVTPESDPNICNANLVIRLSIGVYTDAIGNPSIQGVQYKGNLTLDSEDSWSLGSILHFRRFNFLVNNLPANTTINELLRFALEPSTTHLDIEDYVVHLKVEPQSSDCEATFNPEIHELELGFVKTAKGLTDRPISGTVTSLISSNDLLSNSLTSTLVQKETIHGTLEVNTDYTFRGMTTPGATNGILYLGPGAQIVVKAGNTLTLTSMDIFTCDQLARGIYVESGARLIVNTCNIADCRYAIDAAVGSTVLISNNNFSSNYIGTRFVMDAAPNRVMIAGFNNNTFNTDHNLKAPYSGMTETVERRGYCGILLYDYRDFNVWGSGGLVGGNRFSHLANGIIAGRSTMNLGNMSFEDMNSTGGLSGLYDLEGFGIHIEGKGPRPYWAHINEMWTTMTFEDCKTGIYANRYSAQIDNVTMTDVGIGIDWANSPGSEIRFRENNITADRFGIRAFRCEPLAPTSGIIDNTVTITQAGSGTAPVTGIELLESSMVGGSFSGWLVSGNTVTMQFGGRGIGYQNGFAGAIDGNTVTNESTPNTYKGIQTTNSLFSMISRNTVDQLTTVGLGTSEAIFSSGGGFNTFQCNCVDNTNTGIQFYDLADFTDAVRGNSMGTHTTGLQLGNAAIGDVFIGRQNKRGNLWNLSAIPSGEFGAVNWGGTSQIIEKSRFDVTGAMGATTEHPPVSPGSDWFFPIPGSSFTCASGCATPPSSGLPGRVPETATPTDLDFAVIGDSLTTNTDLAWKGDYRLYRKMLRQTALVTYSTAFSSFKNANDNLATGKLASIAETMANLHRLTNTQHNTDSTWRSNIALKTADLYELDSLLQVGQVVSAALYDTTVQQKAVLEAGYAAFLFNLDSLRKLDVQTLIGRNNSVSTANTPETNHKAVNSIVLNYLLSDTLASGALATLESIAEQCPVDGGDAVYEAQGWVERLSGERFDVAELCGAAYRMPEPGQQPRLAETGGVQVWPNPATGRINWSGLEDRVVNIRVFDLQGRIVLEKATSGNQADLGGLTDGTYIIQLLDGNGSALLPAKVITLSRK